MRQFLHSGYLEQRAGLITERGSRSTTLILRFKLFRLLLQSPRKTDLLIIQFIRMPSTPRAFMLSLLSSQISLVVEIMRCSLITLVCTKQRLRSIYLKSLTSQRYSTYLTARNLMESKATSHNLRPHTRSLCCSM